MAGASATEGEGVVGSHIGETSGVGSEGHSYGWDYSKRERISSLQILLQLNLQQVMQVRTVHMCNSCFCTW